MMKYWLAILAGIVGAVLCYLFLCGALGAGDTNQSAGSGVVIAEAPVAGAEKAAAVAIVPTFVSATVDNGNVTLNGRVAYDAQRIRLVNAARSTFGATSVIDSLKVDPSVGETNGWLGTDSLLGVVQVPQLNDGTAKFDGKKLTLSGEDSSVAEKTMLQEKFVSLYGATGVVENNFTVSVAKVQDRRVKQFLEGKVVEFGSGSARLLPSGRDVLDGVASLLVAEPSTAVAILGHTDNAGPKAANKALSEQRADATKTYLSGRGVGAARMTATGFGDEKPLADNGSPEGRAKNRRIEFVVTEGK